MFHKILVPLDGSPTSNKALTAALRIARDAGTKVRLYHSIDQLPYLSAFETAPQLAEIVRESAVKVLDDALAIAKAAGVEADVRLEDDLLSRIGESVAAEATKWGADLIVVGTHGRRGFSRFVLGSGAEQILRMAPVPVLTVRDEEAARAAS